ncbi:hypothetical protein [Kineosporia sp. A_224]|uniref:hypothetical protein n=1 Tax=Kineosporia sp. A_224 TaxID=1962180 RepID=UPI000B4AE02E|nr:hypothetical protein [Kineosporia sp. A_224]
MSQEPQFGSLFGAPAGSPSAPVPPVPPGTAEVVQSGPSPARPAATAWYRRREAVVAGAGLGVAVVLGAVAFVVLGGGGDDLTTTGATVARSTRSATATGTAVPTTGAVRPANRNPFSGKAAAAGTGSAGTTAAATTTTPAAVTTVVKTVSSVVTTTKTSTRTTTTTRTKTATATVTATPTYVYLLSLTGAAGDAVFVVNGEEQAAASPNDTVVTNLEYTGTSSATCAKVSWKAGAAQTICVGAGTRVDD